MGRPGIFFLVVGPSGVGKDTLIDGARARLDENYVFARRIITRPEDAGGEVHEAATEDVFAMREASGGFLVTWGAHGLRYGLPTNLLEEIAAGRHVIANGSRGTIAEMAERVPRLAILTIIADRQRLESRIAQRGRESGAAIAARLDRKVEERVPDGVKVLVIANDGSIEEGIAKFLAALESALEA